VYHIIRVDGTLTPRRPDAIADLSAVLAMKFPARQHELSAYASPVADGRNPALARARNRSIFFGREIPYCS